MKRIIPYTLLLLLLCACSKNDLNDTAISITLKADKVIMLANGNDKVTFTVTDQTGADRTSQSEIKVNGKAIQGNAFTTTEEGDYVAVAVYKSATSNEVKIQANVEKQLLLTADKATILANGTDQTTFAVTDADGNDVTDKAKIKVNGTEISGNTYVATQPGEYKAIAIYGEQFSNELTIQANKPEAIVLAADKVVIENTGKDKVTFTVTKPDGTDITKESKITVNDKEIDGNTYTTSEVGSHYAIATWNGNKSNSISIKSKEPTQYGLEIVLSKPKFTCDNIDMVTFTCLNTLDNDNDLTDETTFYVDGKAIEGNFLQASAPGEFIITAKYKTYEAPAVKVTAQKELIFTPKIFLELFTGTWCPNCPRGKTLAENAEKTRKVITVSMHIGNSDPFRTSDANILMNHYEEEYVPSLYCDRSKSKEVGSGSSVSKILEFLKEEVNVGIAIDTKVIGDNIEVETTILSKENFPDANCVVLLTENKLVAAQANSNNNIHNHVYRMNHVDNIWGSPIVISSGNTIKKTFVLKTKNEYKKENCEVIVLITNKDRTVINAQRVQVGKKIGY